MRLSVAGASGAFGRKHLDALAQIDSAEIVSVVGGEPDDIDGFARERGIPHATSTASLATASLATSAASSATSSTVTVTSLADAGGISSSRRMTL